MCKYLVVLCDFWKPFSQQLSYFDSPLTKSLELILLSSIQPQAMLSEELYNQQEAWHAESDQSSLNTVKIIYMSNNKTINLNTWLMELERTITKAMIIIPLVSNIFL